MSIAREIRVVMGVDILERVQVIYVFLGDVDRTAPYRPDLVDVAVIEKKGKLRRIPLK